ncbi:MAG: 30S ribosomal protein S17e [Candidatus Heimdallarchaeota archaeon]|nr:30S ribosomal protein S17e [Candidatus Heimdallarchaeota archaeon]
MGRIRQTAIKRTAAAVVEENENIPSEFNEAKKHLEKMNIFDSKRVRNRVAGYIVRILKKKKF